MFEVDNITANIMDCCVFFEWTMKKENCDKDFWKESFEKANTELSRWNKAIGDQTYLCGEKFSMADVFLFPSIAFLARNGAPLDKYPALLKYYTLIKHRPSVEDTWPPDWKDTPNPTTAGGLNS